jgi:nicotinate-nucleotide pyrophosphorylase (carboxylating)
MSEEQLPDITREPQVADVIRRALEEDIGPGDVTTMALVPGNLTARAELVSREDVVVSGMDVARAVFYGVDTDLACGIRVPDGESAAAGSVLMEVEGCAAAILTAERTALNFAQRMTGIATLTAAFVRKVAPYGAAILDTRKTTPTLRMLEKYAVLCGGGQNHRTGLYDRVLIKDNHRHLWRRDEASRLDLAVEEARKHFAGGLVEVEVESEEELRSALRGKPDWILLDNMDPEALARCVAICGGACRLEASGGIDLDSVEAVARSGVDAISLGVLTHSARSADLSLEFA